MIITEEIEEDIFEKYRSAASRLILLDYDGTLVEYRPKPQQAVPSDEVLATLGNLLRDRLNKVIIVTGRDHADIDCLLGSLDMDIIAAHGAIMKENGRWTKQIPGDTLWKEKIRPVMEMASQKCPESFIEDKHFSLAWHYRQSGAVTGMKCSRELIAFLQSLTSPLGLKILDGNMVVEVMHKEIGKGIAVKGILNAGNYDFILSVGDDVTDEEVFELLSANPDAYSIKVGSGRSLAGYRINSANEVVSFLNKLSG